MFSIPIPLSNLPAILSNLPAILSNLPAILSNLPVILSKAKNPTLASETLRLTQDDKGEFRNAPTLPSPSSKGPARKPHPIPILPSLSGGGLGWGRLLSLYSLCLIILAIIACNPSQSNTIIIPPTQDFGGPKFSAVVITSDLAVGQERIAFGIVPRDGPPLRAEQATVRTYYLPPNTNEREPRQTLTAQFQPWPTGAIGVFIAHPQFDTAGSWELEAELTTPDGAQILAKSAFPVKETSDTPAIGDPAPASVTLKASDVPDLSRITTANNPDPALYALSIHEALTANKPLVILFATPAYCVSFTCGPQVQELSELRQRHAQQANFIHIEVFQDPHLIEGGRPTGGLATAVQEWNLPTEPWTFIIDAQGIIRAKFEQYTPPTTIEQTLQKITQPN